MEAEGDAVLAKVNKISDIFSSLTDTVTRSSGLIIKEKLNNKQNAQAIKTQPQNSEEFYNRVSSFRPGLWTARELTPLECARWGWRIQEKDILQCVTCREVVCAILPDVQDFKAYDKYLGLLKTRIVEAHKDACGWKFNPSPEEFVQPPYIGSLEDMRNLTNSARTLAALNSALPYLDVQSLSDSLGADKELIEGLFQNGSIDYEVQASSVLLVLSGWTRGEGAYLRCKVCRRSVGLWSFITRADELERTRAISPAPTPSGKRKRPGEEVEETVEEEEMEEDTSEEPSDAGIRICPPRKCKHLKTDNKGTDSEEKAKEEQETPGEKDSAGKGEENVQSEQEEKMEEEDGDEEKENRQKEETLAKEAEREKTNEKEVKEKIEEGSAQTEDDKEDKSRKELEGRKSDEKEEVEEGVEKEKDESQEEAREKNSSEEKENEAISSDNKENKKNEGEKMEQENSDGKDESQAEDKADEDNNDEDSKTSKENGNGEKMTKENKDEENEKTVNSQSNSEEESQKPKEEEPQVSEEASKDGRNDSKKDTDTTTSQTEKDIQSGAKSVSEEKVEKSPKDVSEEKVEKSPKEVSEEMVEESPKERSSAGDKEQGSSSSKGNSQVQDGRTSQQASALLSPLIIGSSPSTQIRKIDKKQYFHPLEEHRHWCTWTMKILVEEIDEEMSIEKRGYQMVTEQARDILDFASRKDLCSSEKYIRNVEGLRSIRTMLNGLASVDAWLSEDIAEK
ncbi:transcriptional regulator ATRX homolog isoform X2 [Penaeus japonicus]|uniref:transcriptional regulator ATRX homolog isoform X2 n=1 Tax=Penaeus japonicus TaxID=27405 RepID=UPI001C70E622|nr:transcriptional regulator ATRX homolog isoform X2 [Penaeus japonicus]